MTAPNGAIKFNNSTGSDTQSSGLGPAVAVYGSGASTTGASAVVTGINTTGVSAGDLLWVQSSSGRQFSIIASVDSSTQVTCDDNFDNTESSRTWAIGGKRATLAGSQRIYDDGSTADGHGDWIVELEDGYTETLSASINLRVSATSTEGFILRGQEGASTKPVLTFSNAGTAINVYAQKTTIKNIELQNTATTAPGVVGIYCQNYSTPTKIIDVDIHDSVNNFYYGIYANGSVSGFSCTGCSIGNTANVGCYPRIVSGSPFRIDRCVIFNCGSDGIHHRNSTGFTVSNCLIFNNSGIGINIANGSSDTLGNIIHGNATGISLNASLTPNRLIGNIISSCGTGIDVSTVANGYHEIDRNAFYNNTTANVSNYSRVTNSIQLTADPFVDAANGDFNVKNASGG